LRNVARKMKFPLITRFYMKIPFFIPPIKNFGTILASGKKNQILIPDWTYFHCPGATL